MRIRSEGWRLLLGRHGILSVHPAELPSPLHSASTLGIGSLLDTPVGQPQAAQFHKEHKMRQIAPFRQIALSSVLKPQQVDAVALRFVKQRQAHQRWSFETLKPSQETLGSAKEETQASLVLRRHSPANELPMSLLNTSQVFCRDRRYLLLVALQHLRARLFWRGNLAEG